MKHTIQCDIVSAQEEIFSGEASMIFATGAVGELGISPRHAPLITQLKPGPVRVQQPDGEEAFFFVGGGILVHGVPILATWLHGIEGITHALPVAADLFSGLAALLYNAVVGIAAGGLLVGTQSLLKRMRPA